MKKSMSPSMKRAKRTQVEFDPTALLGTAEFAGTCVITSAESDEETEAACLVLPSGTEPGDEFLVFIGLRKCRRCGCTTRKGCATGCHWIELDLCSSCADSIVGPNGETFYVERQG